MEGKKLRKSWIIQNTSIPTKMEQVKENIFREFMEVVKSASNGKCGGGCIIASGEVGICSTLQGRNENYRYFHCGSKMIDISNYTTDGGSLLNNCGQHCKYSIKRSWRGCVQPSRDLLLAWSVCIIRCTYQTFFMISFFQGYMHYLK